MAGRTLRSTHRNYKHGSDATATATATVTATGIAIAIAIVIIIIYESIPNYLHI